jgi:hypothetical protein
MTDIRYKPLQQLCLIDTQELLTSLSAHFKTPITTTHYGDYLYVDNGGDTLAVAHLDTVADIRWSREWDTKNQRFIVSSANQGKVSYSEHFLNSRKKHKRMAVPTLYSSSRVVQSIALDDRLGVYVIVNVLPRLGVKCDYLFTLDEEVGASSAAAFESSKKYNWVFEFDRRCFDPVLYQYDDPALRQLLSAYGFHVTHGSYSDISMLDHLGCKAINFGVGYDWEHTNHCVASMESVHAIARQFMTFWKDQHTTFIPHTPKPFVSSNNDTNWAYFKDNADWEDETISSRNVLSDEEIACDFCGGTATQVVTLDAEYYLCYWCYVELSPGAGKEIAPMMPGQDPIEDNRDDWDDDNVRTKYMGGKKRKWWQ